MGTLIRVTSGLPKISRTNRKVVRLVRPELEFHADTGGHLNREHKPKYFRPKARQLQVQLFARPYAQARITTNTSPSLTSSAETRNGTTPLARTECVIALQRSCSFLLLTTSAIAAIEHQDGGLFQGAPQLLITGF